MNKENAIQKINKYGKIGKIITIIMIVCVSIALATTAITSVVLFCMPEDAITLEIGTQGELTINPYAVDPNFDMSQLELMDAAFDSGSAGLNLGVVRLKLDSAEIVGNTLVSRTSSENAMVSLHDLAKTLLIAVATLVLTLISVIFANRLCRSFQKCQTPFSDDVINKMRYFAWSLLPWAIFSSIAEDAISNIFGNNVEIGVSLDMNIIFTVLVILTLTVVFKYGAMLQQESDETL